MRSDKANVQLVIMAVVAAIVIAISLVITYSIIGSISTNTIDANLGGTFNSSTGVYESGPRPAYNATGSILGNLATFYNVAPIYIVVLAAVGIIAAVMMIMVRRK